MLKVKENKLEFNTKAITHFYDPFDMFVNYD